MTVENNWEKLANELLDLLTTEYEKKFDQLYRAGKIQDTGKNYDDQRDEWVDECILNNTSITPEMYDKWLHGELKLNKVIDNLQDQVQHNILATEKELEKECKKHGLDMWEDILHPMEWNSCERCGSLWESDQLYWQYCDWSEESEELQRGLKKDDGEYTTLCENCVRELCDMGK